MDVGFQARHNRLRFTSPLNIYRTLELKDDANLAVTTRVGPQKSMRDLNQLIMADIDLPSVNVDAELSSPEMRD